MTPCCSNCKFLTEVNREVAPDRGWCQVWCSWQKVATKSCKWYEQKEFQNRRPRPTGNRPFADKFKR